MIEPAWLLQQTVIAVHSMSLAEHGGESGIRDLGLLSSALNRPRDKWLYAPDCTLCDIAAGYSYGLAKNHPFVDGNKRVAFLSGALFLELNGFVLHAIEADAALVFERLAAGKLTESELSSWFTGNTHKENTHK